jgi:hypothetical protein
MKIQIKIYKNVSLSIVGPGRAHTKEKIQIAGVLEQDAEENI